MDVEPHGKLLASHARELQQQIEQDRLTAHRRIGMELLGREERRNHLLESARREVRRWAEQGLCSQDYIDRWSEWLSLPVGELVERMCSDAQGWGRAMRQNSPFGTASE
ncbi:hypothetical protein [Ramlibacter sp. Leaf400]|uniref:hypothetical protein n=1 Tax=Ramlibacter sp. Leaf400 TaxID=1736365 RepID=UPI0007009D90|nr:hypothetical protein [Ramlibacter sp. Leaf400]KQT07569.1 hypothetical protein ASG30_17190 [Ramlibacter sp. Leaf400]